MKIELLCRGMVESNCYALENDGEAVLVDAGAHPDDIDAALQKRGLRLRAILLTHGHFDHILGAEAIAEEHGVPVYIHEKDEEMLSDGMKNAYSVFFGGQWGEFRGAHTMQNGDVLSIFGEEIEVIHSGSLRGIGLL